MEKTIICTVCPRGCHVKVTLNGAEVTGDVTVDVVKED